MTQEEFANDFAFSLKTLMRINNISQAELSKRTGIGRTTVNRYCHGELMPSLKNVINIAVVLDCELDELVTFELID